MKQSFLYLLLPLTLLLAISCDRDNEPGAVPKPPEIVSITALDASGIPLAHPTHTVSADRSTVDIITSESYVLAVDLKLPSVEPKAVIKTGSDWLSASGGGREGGEIVRFVLQVTTNKSQDGRIGFVDFVNTADPGKFVTLMITQRGNSPSQESAPVILAVEAVDNQTGIPLSEIKHKTESPYTMIEIDTPEAYTINLKVESKGSPSDIVVTSGSEWLHAELLKEETDRVQIFRVSISASQLTSMRYGVIRIFSKKDPSKHLLVNISQREGATPDPPKSAPVVTSVVGVSMPGKEPLPKQQHTSSAPFGLISVNTSGSYTLLFSVTCSNLLEVAIEEGSSWLTLGKVEQDAESGVQTFTLTLAANVSNQSRMARIKLANSEAKDLNFIVMVDQVASGGTSSEQLALGYIAPWNIDRDGVFIKSHSPYENQKGMVNWLQAIKILPLSGRSIEGHMYIMPTYEQCLSVIPNNMDPGYIAATIRFNEDVDRKNSEETVVVKNRTITSTNDYYGRKGTNIVYAIRFKGDKKQYSVWRYCKSGGSLVIKQLPVPDGANWTMTDVASEAFWDEHHEGLVTREFALAGLGNADGSEITLSGEMGYFWSSSDDGDYVSAAKVSQHLAYTDNMTFKTLRVNIRPYQIDN